MQEKLLFVLTMANAYIFLQGVPQALLGSSALHADSTTRLSKMRSQKSLFYMRRLNRALPSRIYLPYWFTINGCLVCYPELDLSRSTINAYLIYSLRKGKAFMSHQPKTLIYIEFKFKMWLRLPSVLNECALTWLAGCMERCSCIILHSCKIHELLLMCFPCKGLEILLDPK